MAERKGQVYADKWATLVLLRWVLEASEHYPGNHGIYGSADLLMFSCLFWSMAAMLDNSVVVVVVVVVVRTHAWPIPLAMITRRKSTHEFPYLSHDEYGAPLGGPWGRWSSAKNTSGAECQRALFSITSRLLSATYEIQKDRNRGIVDQFLYINILTWLRGLGE